MHAEQVKNDNSTVTDRNHLSHSLDLLDWSDLLIKDISLDSK